MAPADAECWPGTTYGELQQQVLELVLATHTPREQAVIANYAAWLKQVSVDSFPGVKRSVLAPLMH